MLIVQLYIFSTKISTFTLILVRPTCSIRATSSMMRACWNGFFKMDPIRGHCHQWFTTKTGGGDKSSFVHPSQGFAAKQGIVMIGPAWKYSFGESASRHIKCWMASKASFDIGNLGSTAKNADFRGNASKSQGRLRKTVPAQPQQKSTAKANVPLL